MLSGTAASHCYFRGVITVGHSGLCWDIQDCVEILSPTVNLTPNGTLKMALFWDAWAYRSTYYLLRIFSCKSNYYSKRLTDVSILLNDMDPDEVTPFAPPSLVVIGLHGKVRKRSQGSYYEMLPLKSLALHIWNWLQKYQNLGIYLT